MAAESRRPAVLDRRHDLELGKAQVTSLNDAVAGSFSAEDIGDPRAVTRGLRNPVQSLCSSPCISVAKRSRGLVTERIVLVATRA